jgi:hypothetical protein
LVAIRYPELVAELKEAIADVHPQPEIVVGDSGIVDVSFSPFLKYLCHRMLVLDEILELRGSTEQFKLVTFPSS